MHRGRAHSAAHARGRALSPERCAAIAVLRSRLPAGPWYLLALHDAEDCEEFKLIPAPLWAYIHSPPPAFTLRRAVVEEVPPEDCRAAILALTGAPLAAPYRVSRANFRNDRAAAVPGLAFESRHRAAGFLRAALGARIEGLFRGYR